MSFLVDTKLLIVIEIYATMILNINWLKVPTLIVDIEKEQQ